MAHIHKVGDAETGKDIDTGNGQHTHLFKGERLTSDPGGDQHTHATRDGEETTGPVTKNRSLAEDLEVREMTEEAKARLES